MTPGQPLQNLQMQTSRVDKTRPTAEEKKLKSDVQPSGVGESAFNISNFRSNSTLRDSILPKHSFLVTFSPFADTQKAAKILNRYIVGTAASDLVMRCDSAQLPGATVLKDEVSRFGYGPVEEMAYGMQFADMTLGFIVNKQALHYKFFNEWMSLITYYASKGGGDMMNATTGYLPYQVGYKDDYSNLQMNITVFDRSHNQVMVYELYDVFPISINAQDVSWGDVDQLMRIYVRFAYTDFTLKTPLVGPGLPYNWDDPKPAGAAPLNTNAEPTEPVKEATGQGFVLQDAVRTSIGVISQDELKTKALTESRAARNRAASVYVKLRTKRLAAATNASKSIL